MDLYTLTYRLDGQGSDTIINVADFWQIYNIVDEHYEDIIKAVIEQEGSPEPPTELQGFFAGCEKITEISFGNVDTSEVEDMSFLFNGCESLVTLDIGSFDTRNVTTMEDMFSYCVSLSTLDLGHFDTSRVSNMYNMFGNCESLTSLNVGGFDTSNVTDMMQMFNWCTSLASLDLSNFNTNNVTTTRNMFYWCPSLVTIYVSDLWNNFSVIESDEMFDGCTSLVGAVPYDSSKTDVSMANYTTGYFTKKSEQLIGPFIGEKYPLPPFRV